MIGTVLHFLKALRFNAKARRMELAFRCRHGRRLGISRMPYRREYVYFSRTSHPLDWPETASDDPLPSPEDCAVRMLFPGLTDDEIERAFWAGPRENP